MVVCWGAARGNIKQLMYDFSFTGKDSNILSYERDT